MKRSLAPPRRDRPTGGESRNKISSSKHLDSTQNHGILEMDHHDRIIAQKFEEKYRNKNLNILPTQMLVALSGLKVLDISYNKLTDCQIELIMGSCTKLATFCMHGNLTTMIPASISKLKALINFRHDWVKLNPMDVYESEGRLQKLKDYAKKPEYLRKANRVEGFDFICYVQFVFESPFDKKLLKTIQKCECSAYARDNMVKKFYEGTKAMTSKFHQHFDLRPSPEKLRKKEGKETAVINQKDIHSLLCDTAESATKSIPMISLVLDQNLNEINTTHQMYFQPNFPLHNLFASFDRNHYAPAEIDGLLLKGYNPNQYDDKGLSPYHICVMQKQKRGLEYLLEISSNNPGFFDLEMPSATEMRNILHISVYLRNYAFMKMLIEFGLPIGKRDAFGLRLQHISQTQQFRLLLRKLLRKRTESIRSPLVLSIPWIAQQNKRNYMKHPQRQKGQSRFKIIYSRNDKLLQMFESAVGMSVRKI